jgi:DNA primase
MVDVNGSSPSSSSSSNAGSDFKARVLQATDIVDLIGRSVALKRRGKDFVGLCPFHQEKTPSFHVSPSKQFFHCYGCKAGGNAIEFVIKRDRVDFRDALRTLGEMAGLEMPQFGLSRERTSERQQLLEACSSTCALFEKLLSHPEIGLSARDYLEQRGIDAESVKRFQIGFAPDAWDTVLRSPVARKFPPALLAQAGIVKPRQSGDGFYDTFRNRLMFPIRDENARIIGFGGRVMPGSEDPAKYLNSPETPLFSKSRCVFGLDLGRQRIVETRTVAVVEGYTDVIMAHQFGVSNVVSILGTAMTEQHVNILRRFADRIVLLFDADTAGETAVYRTVELFMTQPVDFAIASMPDGVDPDEYLLEHGAAAFEKLLAEAPPVLQFLVRQFRRRWNASEGNVPEQEKALAAFMEPFLKAKSEQAIDDIRWAAVISTVSQEIGLSTEEMHRRYGRAARKMSGRPVPAADRGEPAATVARPPRGPTTAQDLAERHILGALLSEPQRWHSVQQSVHVEDFSDAARRRLAEVYWAHQRDEGEPVFNEFLSQLSELDTNQAGLAELAIELVEEADALPGLDDAVKGAVLHLDEVRRRRENQKLTAQLQRKDEQLGEQDEVSLLRRLQEKNRQPDLRRVGS